jgi:hypothetical protein
LRQKGHFFILGLDWLGAAREEEKQAAVILEDLDTLRTKRVLPFTL